MVILIVRFSVWSHLDVTVPADHILRFSLAVFGKSSAGSKQNYEFVIISDSFT